jgi:tetratricopeptide (TPR) repeat protein
MRHRNVLTLVAFVLLAAPAFADYGSRPAPPPPPPSSSPPGGSPEYTGTETPRSRATPWYGDAYNDVVRGQKDLGKGDRASAEKRFRKALERSQRAVEIDSTYYEAWNLVGFTRRMLRDYRNSFAAYRTCLRLKPDYAPAREYYGQALLEIDDVKGAREQLAWLRRLTEPDLTASLEKSLQSWQLAHPDSVAQAPADSTSAMH